MIEPDPQISGPPAISTCQKVPADNPDSANVIEKVPGAAAEVVAAAHEEFALSPDPFHAVTSAEYGWSASSPSIDSLVAGPPVERTRSKLPHDPSSKKYTVSFRIPLLSDWFHDHVTLVGLALLATRSVGGAAPVVKAEE